MDRDDFDREGQGRFAQEVRLSRAERLGRLLWGGVAVVVVFLAPSFVVAAAPARIVSLAPSATQMVRSLGAEKRLVAVTPFCEAPDGMARLPGGMFTDPESVLGFAPDLVLCSSMTPADTRRQMADLGLRVEVIETPSLEGIRAATRRVAMLLGLPSPADEATAPAEVGRTAFLLFGAQSGYSTGGGTYMNDILESAGLRNLAAGASSPWPQLSEEFLLQEDPEILVLIGDPADHAKIMSELRAHPVRCHLRAVREDRVVVFPAAALIVPGPRALEAAAKLRALLPPP